VGSFAFQEAYVTWLIAGWLIAVACVLVALMIMTMSKDYDDDQRDGR
jgi:hypothetical protein